MPTKCCVNKCESNSKCPGIKLYQFPWPSSNLKVLTERRIEKWKEALGFGVNFNPTYKRICNLHFKKGKFNSYRIIMCNHKKSKMILIKHTKGKPARITDEYDSDWVPTLRLSNGNEDTSEQNTFNATSSPSPANLIVSPVQKEISCSKRR